MAARKKTKGSQGDEVYELLKWKILNSELALGRFYTEQDLCEVSNFGRSPVRSALSRLQHDRLVEVVPRKGLFIRGWSSPELKAVMEARIILESAAIRLAAKKATPEQVKNLEAIVKEGRKFLKVRDRKGLMRIDHEFHVSIAEASGNPVIAELIASLKQRSNPLWFLTITGDDKLRDVQIEHEAIVAAIKAGDPQAAVKAMNLHIDKLKQIPGEF
ncbi:MAG: GntR family transcriptional regulator [Gammaproteobacteria bacterium]